MNELSVSHKNDLAIAAENGHLGEMLKPLMQEIHLFDSYVAGTTHLADKKVLGEISPGDKLTLRREDNKFDSNAILIFTAKNKKLGYIPEKDNLIFARLMDAGKVLSAKIKSIDVNGGFHKISIGIYLVDF